MLFISFYLYEKLGEVTIPVSGWLWISKGRSSCHSKEVGMWEEEIILRWDTKASQRRKIKNRREIKEIIAPIEETTFQGIYTSG